MAAIAVMLDVERSHDPRKLDEKIQRCNLSNRGNHKGHKEHHVNQDPWAKFRASLSMGCGNRPI
jgi:hypothetical protein